MLNMDIIRDSYQSLRNELVKRNHPELLPPYKAVHDASEKCSPSDSALILTESDVQISIQALLDITLARMIEIDDVKKALLRSESSDSTTIHLEMVCKWGFDGSSGHSRYKQKTTGEMTDGSIFLSCFAPLRSTKISAGSQEKNDILWMNPAPSLTRYCRPIGFRFEKETAELITSHFKEIQEDIETLRPNVINITDTIKVQCQYKLFPSMVDAGTLTEEAQESRNKDLRRFCEAHARKFSREAANKDIIKRFLTTSDPLISSIRQPQVNSLLPTKEMKTLLLD
ncbi:Early transcription factor 82 kDa subunit [Frankliniella fusca]|uniref:Early transcription factor 82 kDa subunit n=1 Tax=Frankliniella fusca TaxID=407009 RepID=A0AAE1HBM8_9NEOP|nr:Early transcription factor 82 kDa subunit [Frankliniella fusca]